VIVWFSTFVSGKCTREIEHTIYWANERMVQWISLLVREWADVW